MFVRLNRRWAAVAAALATIALGAQARAQAQAGFPYVAYVNEPDAYIRSGPDRQHYPTGQLPAGYAVEVYRHDAGGWCAIRPPEGSFSLVPIHQVRLVDDRTAEVTADGVVARVGSSLAAHRNAVQVMLQRGEAVQLVEPPAPGEQWVRIAPPSGEFRWIAARRLARTPPTEGSAQKVVTAGGWHSPSTTSDRSEGAVTSADAADTWPAAGTGPDAGESFTHLRPTAAARDEVEVVAGSPAAAQLAGFDQPAAAALPPDGAPPLAAPPAPPVPAASAPAETLSSAPRVRFPGAGDQNPADARVAELQVRLSQTVVQSPDAWQLASLRTETAALLAQETSPPARDQLRDLLDRIAAFETIQARYLAMRPAALPPVAPLQPRPGQSFTSAPAGLPPAPPPAAGTGNTSAVLSRVQADLGRGSTAPLAGSQSPVTEARYDAVGTLKPVVSRRENAPRFALVDDHGNVVTFVTASPDLNLQAYVGQRIGVKGNRGFMPEYRRAHVTASRVTPLEETVVR